jgi:hypothetical protein
MPQGNENKKADSDSYTLSFTSVDIESLNNKCIISGIPAKEYLSNSGFLMTDKVEIIWIEGKK